MEQYVLSAMLFPLGHGAATWYAEDNMQIGTVGVRLFPGTQAPLFHIECPNDGVAANIEDELDVPAFTLGGGATLAGSARLTKQYLPPGIVASSGVTAVSENAEALNAQLIREHNWATPNSLLSSDLLRYYAPPSEDHPGALLHLPSGADRSELPPRSAERRAVIAHVKSNHRGWYEKMVESWDMDDKDVKPENLFVVLGHVKANAWSAVTWEGSSYKSTRSAWNGPLHMISGYKSSYEPSRGWNLCRCGPHPTVAQGRGKAPVNEGLTQTVFVSYVKIKYRTKTRLRWMSVREIVGHVDAMKARLQNRVMAATGVNMLETFTDPVELVLDYLLKMTKAKAAIATDADVVDLFRDKPWPVDLCRWLEENQPAYAIGGGFAYLAGSECA